MAKSNESKNDNDVKTKPAVQSADDPTLEVATEEAQAPTTNDPEVTDFDPVQHGKDAAKRNVEAERRENRENLDAHAKKQARNSK